MGILKTFTKENVKDKDLVLKMLKKEDEYMLGDIGKGVYQSYKSSYETTDILAEFEIAGMILNEFGFIPSKESLNNYRSIINHYYIDPTNYDKDVMNSVVYLRENKLLYYTSPKIVINQKAPDIKTLYTLDNKQTTLYDQFENNKKVLVCAFSAS